MQRFAFLGAARLANWQFHADFGAAAGATLKLNLATKHLDALFQINQTGTAALPRGSDRGGDVKPAPVILDGRYDRIPL